ncbi:hypothetical protein ABZ016_24000 [Streptomyces sp. NPDC006372]|uniref:hypothetical protein n=1 Tax=Streptomyces sp. NPDC006372 TaxID=3155599 RepID=UPI0033B8A012
MNHTKHMNCADEALLRAERLAGYAEDAAHSHNDRHRAEPLAAVGALWADIARTHAALADALPEETETTDA